MALLRRRGAAIGLLALLWTGCADVPVPDPAVRYIAFGDSTTAGASDRDYSDILRELLGEAPETFVNEGSGGESAADGVARLRGLLDRGLYPNAHTLLYWQGGAQVIDFIAEADPLLLLSPAGPGYPYAGRLAQILDDVQAQIEAAVAAGRGAGLTVYVATYYLIPESFLPCERLLLDTMLPGQARNGNGYIALLNDRIRQAASRQAGILVDVAAIEELAGDAGHYADCNHLNAEGNRIVAARFFETIGAARP